MISSIYLENFKAFGRGQNIPIKPITLIFGPNSSGKSSLIHSLLLINHLLKKKEVDISKTEIGGQSVDLGGFNQYVYKNDPLNKLRIGFSIPIESLEGNIKHYLKGVRSVRFVIQVGQYDKNETQYRLLTQRSSDKTAFRELPPDTEIFEQKAGLKGFEVYLDNDFFFEVNLLTKNTLCLKRIEFENTIYNKVINNVFKKNNRWKGKGKKEELKRLFLDLIPRFILTAVNWTPWAEDVYDAEDSYDIVDWSGSFPPDSTSVGFSDSGLNPKLIPKLFGAEPFSFSTPFDPIPEYDFGFASAEAIPNDPYENIDNDADFNLLDHKVAASLFQFIPIIILNSLRILQTSLENPRYLGPLRSYPPREISTLIEDEPDYLTGGGFAWKTLLVNDEIRESVNNWIGSEKMQTRYSMKVSSIFTEHSVENLLRDQIKSVLQDAIVSHSIEALELGLNDSPSLYSVYEKLMESGELPQTTPEIDEWINENANVESILKKTMQNLEISNYSNIKHLMLTDERTGARVSHRDVGIGLSQVIPVLVWAFAANNDLVLMEQPEIHLHPYLQAELADVFIKSALENKNTFILETHSEHLILRILRRIREASTSTLASNGYQIKPEDVSVIYIKPGSDGAEVYHMEITPDGDFVDPWPDGFFPERAEELFS